MSGGRVGVAGGGVGVAGGGLGVAGGGLPLTVSPPSCVYVCACTCVRAAASRAAAVASARTWWRAVLPVSVLTGCISRHTATVGHASLPSDPPSPTSPCPVLLPACLPIVSVACLCVCAGVRRVWSWLGPQAAAHLRRARASVQRSKGLQVQLTPFVLRRLVTG